MSPFTSLYHLGKKDFDEASEVRKLFPLAAQTYPTPADWLPTTPGQGVTVPQGGVGPTSAPGKERNWDLEGDWAKIKRRFWDPMELPYRGSLRGWLEALIQQWLSNYPRLPQSTIPTPTVEYPAPLKDWLSNYPRLPQSTIPTPTVEYPAPGRPPKYNNPLPWKQPEYGNPFAWRRKNNGWW